MVKNIPRFIAALVVTLGTGVVGAIFTSSQISGWYAAIAKPPFTPPDWVFGPVWTILYILTAISLVRIWDTEDSAERTRWLIVFCIQLALNVMWSFLFFGLHAVLVSCIDIVFLFLFVLILFLDACKLDRPAAYLLVPYLAWVVFAMMLDFGIWWMN
jgi:tryptophan-rich sensory protein